MKTTRKGEPGGKGSVVACGYATYTLPTVGSLYLEVVPSTPSKSKV